MDFKDRQAPVPVWAIDCDAPVEATRTQQRYVKAIGAVGSADYYNCLVRIETVHLHQELVQGLFAFIVTIDAYTTLPPHGIDFIDKDDAGRGFLGLIE